MIDLNNIQMKLRTGYIADQLKNIETESGNQAHVDDACKMRALKFAIGYIENNRMKEGMRASAKKL
jgi:hypothetical protein